MPTPTTPTTPTTQTTQMQVDKLLSIVNARMTDNSFRELLSKKLTPDDSRVADRLLRDFGCTMASRVISSAPKQRALNQRAVPSLKRRLSCLSGAETNGAQTDTNGAEPVTEKKKKKKGHGPTLYNMFYSHKQKQYNDMPMTGVEILDPAVEWQFLSSGKVHRSRMYMLMTAAVWARDKPAIMDKLRSDMLAAPVEKTDADVARGTIEEWFADGEAVPLL